MFRFLRLTYMGAGIVAVCFISAISCIVQTLQCPVSALVIATVNYLIKTGFRDVSLLRSEHLYWQTSVTTGVLALIALGFGFGIGCVLYPKRTQTE